MTMIPALVLLAGVMAGSGQQAAAEAPRCLKALSVLPLGAIAASGDFAPAPCPRGRLLAAFHHDSTQGVSRLSHAVAQGEIVPRFPEFGVSMVQPGQMLSIVVMAGAARIERRVEAMQGVRPGGKLFVRSSDGQILSVRYEARP
jgi:hypothetical protein